MTYLSPLNSSPNSVSDVQQTYPLTNVPSHGADTAEKQSDESPIEPHSMRSNHAGVRRAGSLGIALGVTLFSALPRGGQSLCAEGAKIIKKTHHFSQDYVSHKTILAHAGCYDLQLLEECKAAKLEIENFITAAMEHLDDLYTRFYGQLISVEYGRAGSNLTMNDVHTLREVLENHRLTALDALEDRKHPHCADGLFTNRLFKEESRDNPRHVFSDWKRWNFNELTDNLRFASVELGDTLERLKAENTVDQALRIDPTIEGAAELNQELDRIIGNDSTGHKGLSPYTQHVMNRIALIVNSGEDIGEFGISDGKKFATLMLRRLTIEDPDVKIPTAETVDLEDIDMGDVGYEKCFPLDATVLVKVEGGYEAKMLSDLALGDDVVVSNDQADGGVELSSVVDFSHREDSSTTEFVTVSYGNQYRDADRFLDDNTVSATPNHNIEYGVFNSASGEARILKASFGKLKQAFDDGDTVLVKNGQGEWLPVFGAETTQATGFVAPITEKGEVVIVPQQLVSGHSENATLSEAEALELLSGSVTASSYSTVPDALGRTVNMVQRTLFGANDNLDGAGSNAVYDMFSAVGDVIGTQLGHLN